LQLFVGWALAAGIVPVQLSVAWPGFAGTAMLWVGGLEAPIPTAPSATAQATRPSVAASRPRRPDRVFRMCLLPWTQDFRIAPRKFSGELSREVFAFAP